jgi:multidrug efflux pump subunit AcrA (membrane-fusion protein)
VHQQGVEILTGVEVGEQVVTAGVHSLKAGMKVKPWNKERGL